MKAGEFDTTAAAAREAGIDTRGRRFWMPVDPSKADQYRIYNRLPDPEHPYGDLDVMLKAELGITRDEGRKSILERTKEAAEKTDGKTRDKGRPPLNEEKEMRKLRINDQSERADLNGVSRRTQQKLDRIARDFPEQHERVKAGEVSVHRACIDAGFVKPPITLPRTPNAAVRVILQHFRDAALLELVRGLAHHAGLELGDAYGELITDRQIGKFFRFERPLHAPPDPPGRVHTRNSCNLIKISADSYCQSCTRSV